MNLANALEITGRLSSASKMPCYAWSISALSCKRGSKLHKIPGTVCSKCYARRGNFARPIIQKSLDIKLQKLNHPQWVEAMAVVLTAMETTGYFRWFASGDLQSLEHLLQICEVAKKTPHIRHWLPTHEIGVLKAFQRAGHQYPANLIVRLSADLIDKPLSRKLLKSLNVFGGQVSKTKYNCPAPHQENACQTCRRCWQKKHVTITYKYH
jgi:hypothetical protein